MILPPIKIRNLGVYGVIRPAEVDDVLIPEGAVAEAVNVKFDRRGAIELRPGMATLGATIQTGYPIWGLHNTQNGSMMAVLSQGSSARVYAFPTSGIWTSSLTDGTANTRVRFLEAGGRTVVLNFGSATTQYSSIRFLSTSDTWVTTGNPINPQALTDQVAGSPLPSFGEVYKSRIYVMASNSSRLYYSNVVDSSGNFAWTPSTDWVDINPNDGENATGMKRYSLELLIFKPNYIYRFRTSSVDPDPLIKIGTRSNESIIEGKKGLYFHHDSGFYKYTGGYPLEISRPISDIVNAITYANYSNVVAWKDEDHIYWYVGNTTVDGVVWKNVVCRYTESAELWTVYSHSNSIKTASDYNSGSAITRVAGLDNGVVATYNSGTTDIGEPINYRVITKWYELKDIAFQKTIQQIISICEKAQGSMLMYQIDNETKWNTLGDIKTFITDFKQLMIKCHRIRFKLTGVSTTEGFVWLGLQIHKSLIDDRQ